MSQRGRGRAKSTTLRNSATPSKRGSGVEPSDTSNVRRVPSTRSRGNTRPTSRTLSGNDTRDVAGAATEGGAGSSLPKPTRSSSRSVKGSCQEDSALLVTNDGYPSRAASARRGGRSSAEAQPSQSRSGQVRKPTANARGPRAPKTAQRAPKGKEAAREGQPVSTPERVSTRPSQKSSGYWAELANPSPGRRQAQYGIPKMPGFTSQGGGGVSSDNSSRSSSDGSQEEHRTDDDSASTPAKGRKATIAASPNKSMHAGGKRIEKGKKKRESIKYMPDEKMAIIQLLKGLGSDIWGIQFVGAKDATAKGWKDRVQVSVLQALTVKPGYLASLPPGVDLEDRFYVERLRAWFDSTKAQEAKARIQEKSASGASARRPKTEFQKIRAEFFSTNDAVMKTEKVRDSWELNNLEKGASQSRQKAAVKSSATVGPVQSRPPVRSSKTGAPNPSRLDGRAASALLDLSGKGKGKRKAREAPPAGSDRGTQHEASSEHEIDLCDIPQYSEDDVGGSEILADESAIDLEEEGPAQFDGLTRDSPVKLVAEEEKKSARRRKSEFKPKEVLANMERKEKREDAADRRLGAFMVAMDRNSKSLVDSVRRPAVDSAVAERKVALEEELAAREAQMQKIARAEKRLSLLKDMCARGRGGITEDDVAAQELRLAKLLDE